MDKWLWAARFAKTRSAATDLVLAGHVKVGGERVKPAREVTPGDTIEIRLGTMRRVVVVTGLADRRGPAKVAATLYEETPESREERERLALERRLAGRSAPTSGRGRRNRSDGGSTRCGEDSAAGEMGRPPARGQPRRAQQGADGRAADAARGAGYGDVRTYIASGNVLLDGPRSGVAVARELERLVADEFGVDTTAIVRKPRSSRRW